MLKRHKSRSLMMTFSLFSVLILMLSACGATGTPTTGNGNNTSAVKGGTWTDDLYEEPSSLIPNGSTETFSAMVDNTLWAPLFYGDPTGAVHAGLASEIPTVANGDVSSDLMTWKFKLRPNLKWSDGTPLTAEDVDYTWRVWTGGKFTASSTVGFNLIKSADVSSDKMSITFHLSQKYEPFVAVWSDGINAPMPKHHFSSMTDDKIQKSSDNLKPSVTSGPFMMQDAVQGNHYTVVRNPNYYQAGLPYLDSIVFRIVPDQDTVFKDFQAGNITSAWFLDVTKTKQYQTLSNYKIPTAQADFNYEAMHFNFRNAILGKDVGVRKAIAMAINHDDLIKNARQGQAQPLCTNHGSGYHPGYEPNAPCPKYDVAGANQLLDSEGWVKGSDGVRAKNGQRLEFRYATTAKNPWRREDQLILQSEMQQIGIKFDLENYPADTYFGTILPQGKFDIGEFENSYNFGYDADDASEYSSNQIPTAANQYTGGNSGAYNNPQLDQLFIQEQSTTDQNQRQQAFNQIHQIYLTEFPFITLYGPTDLSVVKKTTHNYEPAAAETIEVWNWWCDGGKC